METTKINLGRPSKRIQEAIDKIGQGAERYIPETDRKPREAAHLVAPQVQYFIIYCYS